MSLKKKNIFKFLFIRICLENGMKFDEIEKLYLTQLTKLKSLTKKEIETKVKSFYKFYWQQFLDPTNASKPMAKKPKEDQEHIDKNQLSLLDGETKNEN